MSEFDTNGKGPSGGPRVFLCHNSSDKDAVRLVAEALELDYGLPYFLDVTAIPTGEAFLPWIEAALRECGACAIFLGGSGWGPTHLWEAELALSRQRKDLDFRVVPVALPGIANAEITRLGAGTLFRDINWADFTQGTDNPEAVEKLRAALTGMVLPGDRGPDRLTPYQIRRDAARWHKSQQRDASILYRGAQLAEANRLALAEADILGVPDVSMFLFSAGENQKRFWQRVAFIAVAAAAVILLAAITAFVQFRIAEQRRLESTSRQLAMLARDAGGADRALLLSVGAYRMSPTSEAVRSLLEESSRWAELEKMLYAGTSVEALAVTPTGVLLVGTDEGAVQTWDITAGRKTGEISETGRHGRVTALYVMPDGSAVWIGREDGQIDVHKLGGLGPELDSATMSPPGGTEARQDRRILSIVGSPDGQRIAAGTADGRVIIFHNGAGRVIYPWGFDATVRFQALAFDGDRGRLLVGDQNGMFVQIEVNGTVQEPIPGFDGGIAKIAVQEDRKITILTGSGMLQTLAPSANGYQFEFSIATVPFVSTAAFDRGRGWLALGDANGNVHLRDSYGADVSFGSLTPHNSVVRAATFAGRDRLVTASADGAIAVWQLDTIRRPPAIPWPPLHISPDQLRMIGTTTLAAGTQLGTAGVWSREDSGWEPVVDLIAKTVELGDQSLTLPANDTARPAPGFEDLTGIEIPSLVLAESGSAVAWTTQGGGVLWLGLSQRPLPKARLLDRYSWEPSKIAISADGAKVAVAGPADTVTIYPVAEGTKPITIAASGEIRSIALDRLGDRLALGLEDGSIQLIHLRDETTLLETRVSEEPIDGIMFDPSELRLIGHGVTSSDRAVVVLTIADPFRPRSLQMRQPGSVATFLTASEDTGYLAAGDRDGQVLLWRLNDLSFVTTLSAGGSNVTALDFDQAAGRLITAASDTGIFGWDLDPLILVSRACAKAGRDFYQGEWTEILPDNPKEPLCPEQQPPLNFPAARDSQPTP